MTRRPVTGLNHYLQLSVLSACSKKMIRALVIPQLPLAQVAQAHYQITGT